MTKKVPPDAPADGPAARFWQAGEPFVLLEFEGQARLYRRPAEVVEARRPEAVRPALDRLRGRHAAGFLAYEAGHDLEPKLAPLASAAEADGPPLLWFGLFEEYEEVDVEALLPDPAGAYSGRPRPSERGRIGSR